MSLELARLALLTWLSLAVPVCSVLIVRAMWRRNDANAERIIGHIKAGALAAADLDDEFGPTPPPAVAAGVQAGRHRGLHLVGSNRPVARRVMALVSRVAAG